MAHLNYAYADQLFVRYQLAKNKEADTVILFGGWPSDYANKDTIEYLREQGYHVFSALYTGIYQSHGRFLQHNPVPEYQALIDAVRAGVIDNLYTNEQEAFTTKKLYFLGSSFGGSIALGAATTYNPDKLLLFAPVWDWSEQSDLDEEINFAKRAFRHVYRLGFENTQEMQELLTGYKEIQPTNYTKHINCPILVLHDPEDKIVLYEQTQTMKQNLDFQIIEHEYGHGLSDPLQAYWSEINDFLTND